MSFKPFAFTLCVAMAALAPAAHAQSKGPLVFAAASMKTALDAIATQYAGTGGRAAPVISYGSSGTLAKQIQSGAPADLFISADEKWMDVLAKDGLIDPSSRRDPRRIGTLSRRLHRPFHRDAAEQNCALLAHCEQWA